MIKLFGCVFAVCLGFVIVSIVVFLLFSDLKVFIGSVKDATSPFSLTLKKYNVERDTAMTFAESKQNNPSQENGPQRSNSYQFFVTIGVFVLVAILVLGFLIMIFFNIFNNTSGKGGSGASNEMILWQKELENKINISLERNKENVKDYVVMYLSDISKKHEIFLQQHQKSVFEFIQKMSENYLDKFEEIVQQLIKIQIEKEDNKVQFSSNISTINQRLIKISKQIENLSKKGESDDSSQVA